MSLTGQTFWFFYNFSRFQLKLCMYILLFFYFTCGVSLGLSLWGASVDGTLRHRI